MKRREFLLGTAALGAAGPFLAQTASAQQASATLMKFAPQANLSALDPVWTTATVTNNHAYYIFDMLYGADENLKPQPQMAEGHQVSADGLLWRITLRDGLMFHDGSPVKAADCAASLKRWTQRDAYGQLLGRAAESFGAADDRTIEIKLKRPFPRLLECLAKTDQPPVIMPERLAKTDANTQVSEMIGSGPYKFVAADYVSGSRVAYEKFDGYKPAANRPAAMPAARSRISSGSNGRSCLIRRRPRRLSRAARSTGGSAHWPICSRCSPAAPTSGRR